MNQDGSARPRVAIVSYPWVSMAPYKFLSDLLQILEPIAERIVLIDGNSERISKGSDKVELRGIETSLLAATGIRPAFCSKLLLIAQCLKAQFRASLELVSIKEDIDVVLSYVAYSFS